MKTLFYNHVRIPLSDDAQMDADLGAKVAEIRETYTDAMIHVVQMFFYGGYAIYLLEREENK